MNEKVIAFPVLLKDGITLKMLDGKEIELTARTVIELSRWIEQNRSKIQELANREYEEIVRRTKENG